VARVEAAHSLARKRARENERLRSRQEAGRGGGSARVALIDVCEKGALGGAP